MCPSGSIANDDEELLTEEELLTLPPFRKIKPRAFAELRRRGLVPFLPLGHRSYLYRASSVRAALRRLERNIPEAK
jgi:hypothetical protein